MTRYGFISVVALVREWPADDYDLQVRARDRETLQQIKNRYLRDASPILATPERDYQFRFYVPRDAFATALTTMAQEITYPNFKDTLRGRLHDLASELWLTIYRHHEGMRTR